jgi:hypothetical protein
VLQKILGYILAAGVVCLLIVLAGSQMFRQSDKRLQQAKTATAADLVTIINDSKHVLTVAKVVDVPNVPGMKAVVLNPDDTHLTNSAWTNEDIKEGDRVVLVTARLMVGVGATNFIRKVQ